MKLICKIKKVVCTAVLVGALIVVPTVWAQAQSISAFPGCEGFGCETPGGRGGQVVFVTNLSNSGPGSLRAALMMTEPRVVVFRVSGTIHLTDLIQLGPANSFVTVAGHTAPGDGIAFSGKQINMADGFHDAVFRHLRFRPGDFGYYAFLGWVIFEGFNIVFDHCSFTWTTDENTLMYTYGDITDITIQYSIYGEPFDSPYRPKGPSFISPNTNINRLERISWHHNYLAHVSERSPAIWKGSAFQSINNVSYNNQSVGYNLNQVYQMSDHSIDIINHYFKEGPFSPGQRYEFAIINWETCCGVTWSNRSPVRLYLSGNIVYKVDGKSHPSYFNPQDQWSLIDIRTGATYEKRTTPHAVQPRIPVTIHELEEGKEIVLKNAGATLPKRDAVDTRLVNDFYNGTGHLVGVVDMTYPDLKTYEVPTDTDMDGMPDEWEVAHGLKPNDGTDHNKDRDGDRYTNIEEWINSIGGVNSNSLRAIPAASPISGQVPLSVSFTGSASGGTLPYSFSWNFGDGGNSTEENPTHMFESAGTYGVVLTVTDNGNNSATKPFTIVVNDPQEPSQNSVHALKTVAPITMDGNLSEDAWDQAEHVTFSNPARSDNQVKVYTLWDNDSLYFAYEVTDPNLEAMNQNYYQDDGAEIYIDTENDKTTSMNTNDYHFMININDLSKPIGIDVRTVTNSDGYTMEISIPWQLINTLPSEGKTMGLLLANNDRDNGASVQFDWLDLIETGSYARPHLWGEIVLSGESVAGCNGDLNGDGRIDVADLQLMVNIILGAGSDSSCADLDDSGVVDIVDLQVLVNAILGS